MARPALDPEDRRTHVEKVRFNDAEHERLRRRAARAGESKVAKYLRELGLRGRVDYRERERRDGPSEPLPSSEEMARQIEAEMGEGAAEAGVRPSGRVASPGASGEPELGGALTPPARAEADRVGEARMGNEEAHAIFVQRRTTELHGQGKTTPVARRLAEAEWRSRG